MRQSQYGAEDGAHGISELGPVGGWDVQARWLGVHIAAESIRSAAADVRDLLQKAGIGTPGIA